MEIASAISLAATVFLLWQATLALWEYKGWLLEAKDSVAALLGTGIALTAIGSILKVGFWGSKWAFGAAGQAELFQAVSVWGAYPDAVFMTLMGIGYWFHRQAKSRARSRQKAMEARKVAQYAWPISADDLRRRVKGE